MRDLYCGVYGMIKAIFHAHSGTYSMVKKLGFTHVEIARNAWPGSYDLMKTAILSAHSQGLNVIVEPWTYGPNKEFLCNKGLAFLKEIQPILYADDLIMGPDEPNLNNIGPYEIAVLNQDIKHILPNKTLITLSSIKSFQAYANTVDIIAVNYQGRMADLFRVIKLSFQLLAFRIIHLGEVWGVPSIKIGPSHIRGQKVFFNILGIENLFWYSFSLDGGKWSPDGKTDLGGLPEWQKAIMDS